MDEVIAQTVDSAGRLVTAYRVEREGMTCAVRIAIEVPGKPNRTRVTDYTGEQRTGALQGFGLTYAQRQHALREG